MYIADAYSRNSCFYLPYSLSRPRKTLNSYAHERNVTFFKVSPLLYVDRPFFFKSWTPNLNAKFKILDSENPWVRIIASVTSLYLKPFRHLGPLILCLKIFTSNSNSLTLKTIDYKFSSCFTNNFIFGQHFGPFRPIEILQIESTSHRPHCKWQRQSGNSVRAKERNDRRFFLSLSTRTALKRDSLTLRITVARADRFQAGLSTLSLISLHGKRTRQFASSRQWRHTPRVCVHLTATFWRSRAHS